MFSLKNWMPLFSLSAFLILLSAWPDVTASPTTLGDEDDGENENYIKRGWKDVSGSWGKRGWNDLQGAWGKRAWERLNGAWGKRLSPDPKSNTDENENLVDFTNEISKRPEWSKFKGSWGKRASGGSAGWSNLKGLWGKRAWDKFGNSWGKKRSENAEEPAAALNEFN